MVARLIGSLRLAWGGGGEAIDTQKKKKSQCGAVPPKEEKNSRKNRTLDPADGKYEVIKASFFFFLLPD